MQVAVANGSIWLSTTSESTRPCRAPGSVAQRQPDAGSWSLSCGWSMCNVAAISTLGRAAGRRPIDRWIGRTGPGSAGVAVAGGVGEGGFDAGGFLRGQFAGGPHDRSANAPSRDSQWLRTVSHDDASSTRAGLRGIARALRRCGIPGPSRNTCRRRPHDGTHSPRMSAGTTKAAEPDVPDGQAFAEPDFPEPITLVKKQAGVAEQPAVRSCHGSNTTGSPTGVPPDARP